MGTHELILQYFSANFHQAAQWKTRDWEVIKEGEHNGETSAPTIINIVM